MYLFTKNIVIWYFTTFHILTSFVNQINHSILTKLTMLSNDGESDDFMKVRAF